MEGQMLHGEEDQAMRITIYLVCAFAVAICIGFAVYIL